MWNSLLAVDCGAGVGRVSKDLLKKYYSEVHLVEVAQPLLDQAKKDLGGYPAQYFCDSLHTFKPSITYDLAWAQWVLGHLTDDDLQAFLERIAGALSPSGLFIIKENVLREGTFILDEEDSSITRYTSPSLSVPHHLTHRVGVKRNMNASCGPVDSVSAW